MVGALQIKRQRSQPRESADAHLQLHTAKLDATITWILRGVSDERKHILKLWSWNWKHSHLISFNDDG